MTRASAVLVVGLVVGLSGCRVPRMAPDLASELAPPLIIGPEAAGKSPPVELPPKEAGKACMQTAQAYEKGGRYEEAVQLYERARTLDPGLAGQTGRRLAVVYDLTGDFSKSTAEYETLLKTHPKDADLLNDVGYSYYCRGELATAEMYLTRALKVDPNHKKANMHLGLVLAVQGKWDDAYAAFCRVVRPADAHCNLAFILASSGKTEEAKDQYRRALAIDPLMKMAQGGLNQLENPKPVKDPAAATAAKADPAAKDVPIDPVEAAAKVPSFAELEARLIKDGSLAPRSIPADGKPVKQE